MTVVITGEKGEGTLTRQGLEEYVSDCVIFLDHRVTEQNSTRRLRVVKYRGTTHGTNEYPFLIDESGISVLPVTSLGLNHTVSTRAGLDRHPAARRDARRQGLLQGQHRPRLRHGRHRQDQHRGAARPGRLRARRALPLLRLRGVARTSSCATCARSGSTCEPHVKERNALSVLRLPAHRARAGAAPGHDAQGDQPSSGRTLVIVDPITNLVSVGTPLETQSMMMRLIDFLKMRGTTTFFTSLTAGGDDLEQSEVGISSLIDTWLMLEVVRSGGERNRVVTIIKSRGMPHSNQTSEFRLGDAGRAMSPTPTSVRAAS